VAGKVEPVFVDQIADMPQAVMDNARDGDVLICMGAGSIGGTPAQVVAMGGSVKDAAKEGVA
jgi:UDP-N-acetylmuramate--alanine ligase